MLIQFGYFLQAQTTFSSLFDSLDTQFSILPQSIRYLKPIVSRVIQVSLGTSVRVEFQAYQADYPSNTSSLSNLKYFKSIKPVPESSYQF